MAVPSGMSPYLVSAIPSIAIPDFVSCWFDGVTQTAGEFVYFVTADNMRICVYNNGSGTVTMYTTQYANTVLFRLIAPV